MRKINEILEKLDSIELKINEINSKLDKLTKKDVKKDFSGANDIYSLQGVPEYQRTYIDDILKEEK